LILIEAHGYSLLRTTPNVDYFHALYDEAKAFGIEIECHREPLTPHCLGATGMLTGRHGDRARGVRNGVGVHRGGPAGGQHIPVQAPREECGVQIRHHADVHGQAVHQGEPSAQRHTSLTFRNLDVQGRYRCCQVGFGRRLTNRHIHVSLRNTEGKNAFAPTKEDLESGGRKNAYHKDLAFVSQEAEWFLAGLIEGLPDSE